MKAVDGGFRSLLGPVRFSAFYQSPGHIMICVGLAVFLPCAPILAASVVSGRLASGLSGRSPRDGPVPGRGEESASMMAVGGAASGAAVESYVGPVPTGLLVRKTVGWNRPDTISPAE